MVLMTATKEELLRRADMYAQRQGIVLGNQLGFGVHDVVFVAKRQTKPGRTAVKTHERETPYCRTTLRLRSSPN
jgi:hypothetical protein